ncbi:MAG: hypothetical protein AB3N21_18740 [Ruegeria sp.]|uniref:hypothetical protein n=1 Tax=Ruegeria sp. TaxID=1879320 RepID=UPI00349E4E9B
MKKILLGALVLMTACGRLPGPSIPMQSGHNLHSARAAVQACSAHADRGGKSAVVGGYVSSIILAGVIVGPIVVASNQRSIRAHGEVDGVDRCLSKRGFERRDLTSNEVARLSNSTPEQRERILDHLVGGGNIDTFGLPSV